MGTFAGMKSARIFPEISDGMISPVIFREVGDSAIEPGIIW